jgi:hypothetical protein
MNAANALPELRGCVEAPTLEELLPFGGSGDSHAGTTL